MAILQWRLSRSETKNAQLGQQLARFEKTNDDLSKQLQRTGSQLSQSEQNRQRLQNDVRSANDRMSAAMQQNSNLQSRVLHLTDAKNDLTRKLAETVSRTHTAYASKADISASEDLTRYLFSYRLKYVFATLYRDSPSDLHVVLTGYVKTDRGMEDVESRTREYLRDPGVRITNLVQVRPDLDFH